MSQPILTPVDIKHFAARNRLAVAPMTRVSASPEGLAGATMTRYYERFARGGFGLVITEGIYTDRRYSQGYLNQPGITDDAQARAWQPVVDGIHAHGALAFAQLMHAGALSQGNRFVDGGVAPSAVQPKGQQMAFYHGSGPYRLPAEISEEQIADAIAAFASAARRSVGTAGFDGIEIHGANGYLLDQFLTAHTNLRTDRWGGDVRRRLALTVAVVEAVRAAVGNDVPVGVRISQGKVNDFTHKWGGGAADAEAVFGTLADAGVDFLHVTEFEAWQPAFPGGAESLVKLARRHAPSTTLIANGNLHDPLRAAQALADGADIVALGRGALANPDLPRRLAQGAAQAPFDGAILGPIADIKESELA
jgi:2,4-dienoyl-CoA reductase-like NADH-dependent reductase (Old Yellow Enzyme family)